MPPWWGYSKTHGWVVIDRTLTPNKSGLSQDILYFRCRDTTTFLDSRSRWRAPLYIYATSYLASLAGPEAEQAAQEFEALKQRWGEFQIEILRQYELSEAQRKEQALARLQQLEEAKKAKSKRKPRKAAIPQQSEPSEQGA